MSTRDAELEAWFPLQQRLLDWALREFYDAQSSVLTDHITLEDCALKRRVTLKALQAHIKKTKGRCLSSSQESMLVGYSLGIRSEGENSNAGILEMAQRLQDRYERGTKPLDRQWLRRFFYRHNMAVAQPMPNCEKKSAVPENFSDLCEFWQQLAQHSTDYQLADASQYWYLSETTFFGEFCCKDQCGVLGTVKAFDDDLRDLYDCTSQYPVTALVAYSADGQLVPPTILYEEEEFGQLELDSGPESVCAAGTPLGLLDEKQGLNWLKTFEASSKGCIKSGQWRLLIMDGSPFIPASSAISREFLQFASDHKIIVVAIKNSTSIHSYLCAPVDVHYLTEMKRIYHDTKDPKLCPGRFMSRKGLYDSFSGIWKDTFANSEVCRKAFKEAGVFPVDMRKNEKAIALAPQPKKGQKAPEIPKAAAVKSRAPLSLQQVQNLVNKRLEGVRPETAQTWSTSLHGDYALLEHVQQLLQTQQSDSVLPRKSKAPVRRKTTQVQSKKSSATSVEKVGAQVGLEQPESSVLRRSKRAAPQTQNHSQSTQKRAKKA